MVTIEHSDGSRYSVTPNHLVTVMHTRHVSTSVVMHPGTMPQVHIQYWAMQSGLPTLVYCTRRFVPRGHHAWEYTTDSYVGHGGPEQCSFFSEGSKEDPIIGLSADEAEEYYADLILSPLQVHDSSTGDLPAEGALLHRGTLIEIPAHLLLTSAGQHSSRIT